MADIDQNGKAIVATPDEESARQALATTQQAAHKTMQLIEVAVEKGQDVQALANVFLQMQEHTAKQAFAVSMHAMQRDLRPIEKNATAVIESKRGGSFTYSFADLPHVERELRPLLHRHGFSYTWSSELDGAVQRVTIRLRHVGGHVEETTFACPVEQNTRMGAAASSSSAVSRARRYALLLAVGASTCERDVEGAGAGPGPAAEPRLSDEQEAQLIETLGEYFGPRGDRLRDEVERGWLAWLGVEHLGDLGASRFEKARRGLERKRASLQEEGRL